MIQLTLPWFVFIYLAVFLAGVLLLWIGYEMVRKYLPSHSSFSSTSCRICGKTLENDNNSTLLQCPSCGCLSERNSLGGL